MTESAKLLEISKQEPSTPPTTPEKSPSNIIKERLNLHVKRRLQQEAASPSNIEQQQHQQQHGTTNYGLSNIGSIGDGSNKNNNKDGELNKRGDKQVKTRKPYQKRTEKTAANDASAATVRKYKRNKTKQIGSIANKIDGYSATMSEQAALPTVSNVAMSGSHGIGGGGGGGDDGDGSHDGTNDAEVKCSPASRDKDKSPDVLSMVLSAKKRALMQHPDVQAFLNQVMEAIKS